MKIDTGGALEIEASAVRMLGLSVLGLVMTALSAVLALHVVPGVARGGLVEFCGWAGMVFFAACSAGILWRTLTAHGPVVTITPEGIRDTRVAAELIPWRAVDSIKVWESQGQRVLVLAVDPTVEQSLTLTRIARWSRGANRCLGADGLCITAQGLKLGFDDLLQASLSHARARHSHTAAALADLPDRPRW